ncbi:MAG TPA: tetratricopeptide repeat protein [Pyrinomonadaceae bacterium]|nr:tetratricopeptide repeat protein [Pyrinomonadaceae bacterium]
MKKIALLILIACAAASNAGAVQRDAQVYARDGARFALEGRLAEAARSFEQAVALDPSNGNAFYALGNVYAEMGRWADAINAYYRAVSLNKEDVEALNNLGVALGMRGQHVQAAGAFQRAIKVYPKWAEPHYHLGVARRALGQEEEAREAFERALKLRPDYAARPPRPFAKAAPAPRPAGGVLEAMRAVNLGDSLPERVAATPPSASPTPAAEPAPRAPNPSATPPPAAPSAPTRTASTATAESPYQLGVREARAGRHREAVAAFREAVALERRNAAAYRALGDAYAALENWGESVDAYEQAARLAPGDAETYQKLGRAYAKLRETAPAPSETSAATPAARPRPAATAGAERPSTNDPDPTAVYRIGPGDVLDVRLPGAGARRAATYEVTPSGLLDHPALREPVAVAGLTTEEVGARLASALGLRTPNAEVAVGVSEYRSHAIIVGGMVKDGGTKILQREGVPLYVIVAYAQPLPGAGQAVIVSRATASETAVDLTDSEGMKTLVRQGDVVTLRARPRQFVYVAGAVREPGQREFHAGLTLTQALLAAGGATSPNAAVVNVTRQAADGKLSTSRYVLAEIKSGRTPDPTLRPGDRVEVLR